MDEDRESSLDSDSSLDSAEEAIFEIATIAAATLYLRKNKNWNPSVKIRQKRRKIIKKVPTIADKIQRARKEIWFKSISIDLDFLRNFLTKENDDFRLLLHTIEKDPRSKIFEKLDSRISEAIRFLGTRRTTTAMGEEENRIIELCQVIYTILQDEYLQVGCGNDFWLKNMCREQHMTFLYYKSFLRNPLFRHQLPETRSEWCNASEIFKNIWHFPNCLGILDVRHIGIQQRPKDDKLYCNSEGFDSIALLALVDAEYRFLYVDASSTGNKTPAYVLRDSSLDNLIRELPKMLPPDVKISANQSMPFVFIGEMGFPLQENIMIPYSQKKITKIQEEFNKRLTRARYPADNAFQMLFSRFPILESMSKLHAKDAQQIVLTCCVLHNFLLQHSPGYRFEMHAADVIEELRPNIPNIEILEGTKAVTTRLGFALYFSNEGKLL